MRAVVVGAGAVGARVARQLLTAGNCDEIVVCDVDTERAGAVAESIGPTARVAAWDERAASGADAVVVACRDQLSVATPALRRGAHVVTTAGALGTARGLLGLDAEARERGRSVVVGAGFSPGLSCLLARHAADALDELHDVTVARVGRGGPACVEEERSALGSRAVHWHGAWHRAPGGSGRQTAWFPAPVGARDCYNAAVAEPVLLADAFPSARSHARVAASLGARLRSRLPAVRRGRGEDRIGAIRVEARGVRNGSAVVDVFGAVDRPALAAAAVAAVATAWAAEGRFTRTGAAGLASLVSPALPFLHELAALGVRAATLDPA